MKTLSSILAGLAGLACCAATPYMQLLPSNDYTSPMFGCEIPYRIEYSPDFPFEKARLEVAYWDEINGYSSSTDLGRDRCDRFRFGVLFRMEEGTKVEARFQDSATGEGVGSGGYVPASANILFRRFGVLIPGKPLVFAVAGDIPEPENGIGGYFDARGCWSICTLSEQLPKTANRLVLTLRIDGLPEVDEEAFAVEYASQRLNALLGELECPVLQGQLPAPAVPLLEAYWQALMGYESGCLPLLDALVARDAVFAMLLTEPQSGEALCTALRRVLRLDFSRRLEIWHVMYDAGTIPLSDVEAAARELALEAQRLQLPPEAP